MASVRREPRQLARGIVMSSSSLSSCHAATAVIHGDARSTSELIESEALFRATFENAAVGIAHVAPDGSFLRVNSRLCELTGYPAAELITKTFQDITHPDDCNANLAHFERALYGEV